MNWVLFERIVELGFRILVFVDGYIVRVIMMYGIFCMNWI